MAPFRPRSARLVAAATLPEVEFYFHLLVLIHLIDTECYNEVREPDFQPEIEIMSFHNT